METFVDEWGIIRRVGSNTGARPAPTRPTITPPTAPRRPSPPTRRVGYQSGEPHRLCGICLQPAHFAAGTLLCAGCAAAVAWRVGLAQQGLKVVS